MEEVGICLSVLSLLLQLSGVFLKAWDLKLRTKKLFDEERKE
jgi:hypothetical protein